MMTDKSTSRAIAVVCFLTLAEADVSVRSKDQTTEQPLWRISALVLPRASGLSSPPPYWIGFHNTDVKPKLICLNSWTYVVRTPKGNESVGPGPSPHGCRGEDAFDVVLKGETLYRVIVPTLRRVRVTESTSSEIIATLVERDLVDHGVDRTVTLTWMGTLEDALVAGRRLAAVR